MKKVIPLFLAIFLSAVLLFTSGCSAGYIMTAKGEKQDLAYYSFYVHWQRDYYKELLKNYGYDISTCLDNYYTETETVRQTIVSTAKSQYLSFVVVSQKFEELGLTLSEDQQNEINSLYNDEWLGVYGKEGMKTILKDLGLKESQFLELLSVQAKSDAILDYYYGETGLYPITAADKKKYFEDNYMRFKYILLSIVDDNDKPLPADERANKRTLADSLCKQAQDGANFEELIQKYSEDYVEITDDMTEEEKAAAEENNASSMADGLICDSNGIFNQTLYTYYNISVHANIISRLKTMKPGEFAVVETDTAVWVIQECDLNEEASFFEDREETIFQTLYASDFNSKYTQWLAELEYEFNEAALASMDPENFTDLFSKVYSLEDGSKPTEAN